jgi:hypothetical protein
MRGREGSFMSQRTGTPPDQTTRPTVPPLDLSPSGRLPHVVATAEPNPGRPLHRDPTAARAVSRTSSAPTPAAPVPVLRHRLVAAIGRDDAHGVLLLAGHLARAAL